MTLRAQTEPLHHLRSLDRYVVADTVRNDRLHVGTVVRPRPSRNRPVLSRGSCCLAHVEDIRPLLHRLIEVLGIQRGVLGSVPQLHPWTRAGVTRISRTNQIAPLLRRLGELTVGARAIPHAGTCETSIRDSSEGGSSLEEVWVRAGKYVGHHGA